MDWPRVMADVYHNMFSELEKVLEGLTVEDLHKRPFPGANPISWLCWHTIRSCDRLLGDVVLGEQLWLKDGWYKRFNKPPDFNDTGKGYSDAQVDALRIPDIETLLDYEHAVKWPLLRYIKNLTEEELGREVPTSWLPGRTQPVHSRLIGVLNNLQHVGQAGYVRGIIKGHGWYGR